MKATLIVLGALVLSGKVKPRLRGRMARDGRSLKFS